MSGEEPHTNRLTPLSKQTIMDLYNGNLDPYVFCKSFIPDYSRKAQQYVKLYSEFSKKLSPELREEYENTVTAKINADNADYDANFVSGFILGMRLAAESFYNSGME